MDELSGWEWRRRDEHGNMIGHAVEPRYFRQGLKELVPPGFKFGEIGGARFSGKMVEDVAIDGSGISPSVFRLNQSLAKKKARVENLRVSTKEKAEMDVPREDSTDQSNFSYDSEEYREAQETLGGIESVLHQINGELTAVRARAQRFGKDLSIWEAAARRAGGLSVNLIGYAQETTTGGKPDSANNEEENEGSEVPVGFQRAKAVTALQELGSGENVHDNGAVRALQSEIARVDVKVDLYRSRKQRVEQVVTPIEQHFISSHPKHRNEKVVNLCKLQTDPLMIHPKKPLPFSRPTSARPNSRPRSAGPGQSQRPKSAVITSSGRPIADKGDASNRPMSAPGVGARSGQERPQSGARAGIKSRPMSARSGRPLTLPY